MVSVEILVLNHNLFHVDPIRKSLGTTKNGANKSFKKLKHATSNSSVSARSSQRSNSAKVGVKRDASCGNRSKQFIHGKSFSEPWVHLVMFNWFSYMKLNL